MAVLTKADLNRIVGTPSSTKSYSGSVRLAESDSAKRYDVFLSHSSLDKETVLQVNDLLEDRLGLSVYVDWIEDPSVDRTHVTPANAAKIRQVMKRCKTLLYAVSDRSSGSTWMPWELGYSDATHGKVAVLPIAEQISTSIAYKNQQFVGIYPIIDYTGTVSNPEIKLFWLFDPRDDSRHVRLLDWIRGAVFKVD